MHSCFNGANWGIQDDRHWGITYHSLMENDMKLNHLLSTIMLCIATGVGFCVTTSANAWSGLQDAGGTMVTDPSCTTFAGTQALCASVSTDGTLTVNHFDGTRWTGPQDAGGVVVRKPNCTHESLFDAMCAVIGVDQALYVNHFNGAAWSGFTHLGGVSMSDPACTGITGLSEMHCAIIGVDGALWVNDHDGIGWSGFKKLGGNYIYNPTCTEDYTFGGAFCAAVTTDGKLDGWKYANGVWGRMPNPVSAGAAITADPSCTGIGRQDILCAVRAGNSLRVNFANNGFTWPRFSNLGGILAGAPSCTLSSSPFDATPTAVCAVRGINSAVFINSFNGSSWSGYQALPGTTTVGAPSCTATNAASQPLCAARGTNNHLYISVGQ
jgi:hypothetical protein